MKEIISFASNEDKAVLDELGINSIIVPMVLDIRDVRHIISRNITLTYDDVGNLIYPMYAIHINGIGLTSYVDKVTNMYHGSTMHVTKNTADMIMSEPLIKIYSSIITLITKELSKNKNHTKSIIELKKDFNNITSLHRIIKNIEDRLPKLDVRVRNYKAKLKEFGLEYKPIYTNIDSNTFYSITSKVKQNASILKIKYKRNASAMRLTEDICNELRK